MAIDFQVVLPSEVIQVSLVKPVAGLPVRTLEIHGSDFSNVDQVLINDVPSPDVAVLTRTRLLAQVPESLQTAAISTISVLSKRLVLTDKSFIRFRITDTPGKVRGILRLMQVFLKILLTTPGTDIFNRKIGGGALRYVGKTYGKDEGAGIVSGFIVSVDQTARQLVQIQSRDPSLPPDERLLSANVVQAGFNKYDGALLVSVELINQTGKPALARLEV